MSWSFPDEDKRQHGANVIDSYLGIPWCGNGLHLLEGANVDPTGRCRPCSARAARTRRAKKRSSDR